MASAAASKALGGTILPRNPHAPRFARTWLRSKLDGVSIELDDVVLMVDEVATNALLHGAGRIGLRLLQQEKTIRVEVTDGGTAWAIEPKAPTISAENGRGLMILDGLAASWGVVLKPGRTTVWFEVDFA